MASGLLSDTYDDQTAYSHYVDDLCPDGLQLEYGAGKPVTIELIEKNNKAFLSVKDSGMGISRDHQQKIFDRYYRVNDRPDANSLGLGLYITRLIVDAHHGKISIESEEGKGSTFTVEIPFA